MHVPPKIKNFMWRLRSQGVDCVSTCVVCQSHSETNWHTFIACVGSIKIMCVDGEYGEGFEEVFERHMDFFETFSGIGWSVWKRRNKLNSME